ncbi:metallophosphoesterase [Mycoplasmatota bacterium WC44]
MKFFCVSDLHGNYKALVNSLKEKGFDYKNDDHTLLILGDLFDRGTENTQLWNFVNKLAKNESLIFIRGNHDNFFIDFLRYENSNKFLFNVEKNGFGETIKSFSGIDPVDLNSIKQASEITKKNYEGILEFFHNTKYYFETENYIFVHAGINTEIDDWKETSVKEFTWMKDFYEKDITNTNKIVVFGHVNTILLNEKLISVKEMDHEHAIWYGKQKIGIDGKAYKTSKVNVLIIEDELL